MEPSRRVSLKGLKRTQGRKRVYTSSAPSRKVKPTSSCDGIDGVSMAREQTSFAYVSSCCLSPLNRRRVAPLYIRVTPVGSESPNTDSYSYPGWSLLVPNLYYKYMHKADIWLQVVNRLRALGLYLPLWALTPLNY